ncbi:MAG: SH3 domain-containing protein [Clostridium sp.]|nr:SH3 domain-containing protein [Clostridium sp.]
MKKRWQHSKSSIMRGALIAVCAVLFFASQKSVCFAEVTGKVKAPTANIRKTADKSSEGVGSTSSGKTITILSQTTGSDGYVWYEVYVDTNTTGYIRSDLVDVDTSSGTIPTSSASAPAQSSEQPAAASTASGAEILPETGMDAQYATITGSSVNVRSAASKSKATVGKVKENAQVIVTGQTEGSDKTWYYVTFTDQDGTEKTGYIRSDMLTLGDMVPVEEPAEEPQPEESVEEPQPEAPTIRQDYDIIYEVDSATGESVGWIYDYTDPANITKQNLNDVLTAAHAQSLNNALDAKTVSKQRIVIIVLIAVIIILAVVMTIMIFKLRDAYYEAYEDEEDEEDEAERRRRERREKREREAENDGGGRRSDRGESRKSDARRNDERSERAERRREREDGEDAARRKNPAREDRPTTAKRRPAESDRDRKMPDREVSYEEEAPVVKAVPKKKAKNFMIDDDDFEFEFLNMKNKDNDI